MKSIYIFGYVMSMSSSSSYSDWGSGMDRLFTIVTWGLPFIFLRKASLYLMGMQGHSCQLLAADIVEFVLYFSEVDCVTLDGEPEVESMALGQEHELCDEGHVVGV